MLKSQPSCQRLFVTSDFFYLAPTRSLVTGFTVYQSLLLSTTINHPHICQSTLNLSVLSTGRSVMSVIPRHFVPCTARNRPTRTI